ncbi:DUF2871 family protein [Actinomadura sp. GTD37]|uniref:DUF2871 family protein n=1 Tax=Actinomadura sp. GTD37 TaxID=1778030 RepID=UPI0035C1C976
MTALELELYPAPVLYGGRVFWPEHRTREVYEAFLEITAEAPRELSVWINRLQPPGAPPMVTLDLAYLGETAQGLFTLTTGRLFNAFFWTYNAGLVITVAVMTVRGTQTVLGHHTPEAAAAIAGIGKAFGRGLLRGPARVVGDLARARSVAGSVTACNIGRHRRGGPVTGGGGQGLSVPSQHRHGWGNAQPAVPRTGEYGTVPILKGSPRSRCPETRPGIGVFGLGSGTVYGTIAACSPPRKHPPPTPTPSGSATHASPGEPKITRCSWTRSRPRTAER